MIQRNHAGDKSQEDPTAFIHPSVEGVTIKAGMHVPSMTPVRNEEDVRGLGSSPAELAAFANKVRRTNVILAEVF